MGFMDDAKNLAAQAQELAQAHPDQVKAALGKIEETVDDQTGHQHTDAIHNASAKAEGFLTADQGAAATAAPDQAPE